MIDFNSVSTTAQHDVIIRAVPRGEGAPGVPDYNWETSQIVSCTPGDNVDPICFSTVSRTVQCYLVSSK